MEILSSYGMLLLSTVMFGTQFFFNDVFRRNYGNSFRDTLVSRFGGGLFSVAALFIIQMIQQQKVSFEYSNYAFIMAFIANLSSFLLSYCGLKALGKINLSMYSLFMMLGGMVLPFASGILLHGEALTLTKLLCFIVIIFSLVIVKDIGKSTSGTIYYIGVFVLNGMAGVISKLYHAMPSRFPSFTPISPAGYSVLMAIISVVLSGVMLLFVKGEKKSLNAKAVLAMGGGTILNKIANLLLIQALLVLPASSQYPFVTGGTIIVSAIISLFTDKKPTKRELVSVAVAFIGVLLLFVPDILKSFNIDFNDIEIFKMGWQI